MRCPKCGSRSTGRIGQNQFYCWDCSVEFIPTKDGFRTYRVEADGTLLLESPESTGLALGASSRQGELVGMGSIPRHTSIYPDSTQNRKELDRS